MVTVSQTWHVLAGISNHSPFPSTATQRGLPSTYAARLYKRLWYRVLMAVLCGVAATLTAAVVGPLAPAAAHTDLVSSVPTAQARLAKAPLELRFTFTEDVEPAFATVALAIGNGNSENLSSRVTGRDVWATSPPASSSTEDQDWKVAYRVVSTDGHPVSGTLTFTVLGTPTSTTSPEAGTPNPSTSPNSPPSTGPATATDSHVRTPSQRFNLPLAIIPVALIAPILLAPILIARRRRHTQQDAASSNTQAEPPSHNE